MPSRLALLSLMLLLPVLFAMPVLGTVTNFDVQGFTISDTVHVPGSPKTAFDTMTGDIKPWWDHSMSGNPQELRIDPFAGGQFYEVMPNEMGTVEHARVIFAMPGKLLRLHGPLGLSGRSIDMVSTLTYEALGQDSTMVILSSNITGQIDDSLARIVSDVWRHFLHDRLKPYMEGTLEE